MLRGHEPCRYLRSTRDRWCTRVCLRKLSRTRPWLDHKKCVRLHQRRPFAGTHMDPHGTKTLSDSVGCAPSTRHHWVSSHPTGSPRSRYRMVRKGLRRARDPRRCVSASKAGADAQAEPAVHVQDPRALELEAIGLASLLRRGPRGEQGHARDQSQRADDRAHE